METVKVIGMGLSPRNLTADYMELIETADILIGGRRLLDFFKDCPAVKKEIKKNIKGLIQYIKDEIENSEDKKSIVVLASGDPLFFGIGSLLATSLGKENVKIYPNISSVSAAFAAIKESWQDAHVVSLHGRDPGKDIFDAIATRDKIAVFTDQNKNPAWLAAKLLAIGMTDFKMCVLEQIGSPSENIGWYKLPEAAGKKFLDPNIVILKRIPSSGSQKHYPLYPGMPDHWFEHQQGLITKAEIRAVTLSKLRLYTSDLIFWDLGAGSGSVSIEAAQFIRKGKIIAIERKADRIEQIKSNRKRFKIANLEIIQARLPEGLENLPRADRIFIGGGGRDLENIIRSASRYLNPNGVIVINTVLLQNIETAINTLKTEGFVIEIVQVQISRGHEMPFSERLEAQNPVWIISGIKRDKENL